MPNGDHQLLTAKRARMGSWTWSLVTAVMFVRWATSAGPGVVRFSVIAPLKASKNEESLGAILPSVDLAARAIAQPNGPLPGWDIRIQNRDSNCSSTDGPLAAFELHTTSGEFKSYFVLRKIKRIFVISYLSLSLSLSLPLNHTGSPCNEVFFFIHKISF